MSFESEKQSEIIILRVNTCTSQFKYESIEIQMTRYCYSFNLHVRTEPRSLYCITSNIKYVIIKECKQKDDLVHYTESATQSLSVYLVQYTLHHGLLSSHLCSCGLQLLECHRQPPVQHLPDCTSSCPVRKAYEQQTPDQHMPAAPAFSMLLSAPCIASHLCSMCIELPCLKERRGGECCGQKRAETP